MAIIRDQRELASLLRQWQHTRTLPKGVSFYGFQVTADLQAADTDDHKFVHPYTVKCYYSGDDSYDEITDIREKSMFVDFLEGKCPCPEKVSPWPFPVDYTGIDSVPEPEKFAGKIRVKESHKPRF